MSDIIKPTCKEIYNETGFKHLSREDDMSWRHGSYRSEVYLRESDNTYWGVYYRVSKDGETNELRDGEASIIQVEPYEEMVVKYREIK